jgi:hypothetical protein
VTGNGPELQHIFREWLNTRFSVTGGLQPLQTQPPQAVLGMSLEYNADYIRFSMEGFVEKALATAGMLKCNPAPTPICVGFTLNKGDCPSESEQAEIVSKVNTSFAKNFTTFDQVVTFYRSLTSSLGWIAKSVAPTLSYVVSLLSRVMHCPPWKAFGALKRVYSFLNGQRDIGITYRKVRDYDFMAGERLEWVFKCDAAFADDAYTRRSQAGFCAGPKDGPPTSYGANQLKKITTSSNQSESASGFIACKDAVYTHNTQGWLGVRQAHPFRFEMDNEATVLATGAPIRKFSPASKHFDIEDKYVVQCSEDKIIKVVHVPGTISADNNDPQTGDGFCADAFTKPMPRILHDLYMKELQGVKP